MAIRITVSYSGYVAANLAGCRVGNSRVVHECWIRSKFFGFSQKPEVEAPSNGGFRFMSKASAPMCSTMAGELLGDGVKNPLILGLVAMLKSSATVSGVGMGVSGASAFKASSILPFLPGSKRLLSKEGVPDARNKIDEGGTVACVEDKSQSEMSVKTTIGLYFHFLNTKFLPYPEIVLGYDKRLVLRIMEMVDLSDTINIKLILIERDDI